MGGALTHQVLGASFPVPEKEVNDAVRKLQDQNRNYEDIFITSEFSGEQIQVKIGDCVDAKHPLWSEFDIITKLGYVTQLGEHGKKDTNKVTIRFLDDGEHTIPKKWIERVGDEVDYVDTIACVMVDDAAELPSSPLPKRSSPLKRLQSRIGLPKRTRRKQRAKTRVRTHSTDPVAPNTKKSSWRDFLSGLVLVALCMGGLYLRFC